MTAWSHRDPESPAGSHETPGDRSGRWSTEVAGSFPVFVTWATTVSAPFSTDAPIVEVIPISPAMVGTAMELTAAALYDQVPVHGSYILDATLVTKDNAKDFYFPDSPF